MMHENVKEIRRSSSDLGLGVRFKSGVTVQAPAQFGTHKNDPSKYSGFVTLNHHLSSTGLACLVSESLAGHSNGPESTQNVR